MTNTTAALEAEAKTYKSEIERITAAFALVAAKEEFPKELASVGRVAVKSGYLRWSARAKRYMFTPEGQKFYRQMKKFSPRLRQILR